MIRALVVDDEPLARRAIRAMLRRHPDVEIAAECSGGAEAVEAIRSLSPQLVFLDVQMPEMDGFAVVETIGAGCMPNVIFVTAYDQYAVRAFEVHALDYLLKPFCPERFDAALERARERLRQNDWAERLTQLLNARRPAPDRFLVRTEGRAYFVPFAEIDWIEAQGNYALLHGGGRTHPVREPLTRLEARLDPRLFRRIHRSTIVNLAAIRELRAAFHGEYEVILRDGTELKLSRKYRPNLEKDTLGRL